MSTPSLPPEILDYIADFLHDEPETLRECCLVAKSWIPRTRKHLFANIQFRSEDELKSWKTMFPDSANSPAHHARTLFVGCADADVMASAEETGWIRAFSGVTSLGLDSNLAYIYPQVSLVPFCNFLPTLKSLRASFLILPSPQLFTFVLSSPFLEDLTVTGVYLGSRDNHDDPHTAVPLNPPPLTGTLGLEIAGGMGDTARKLLDLPNGLHFRKLVFSLANNQDAQWVVKLLIRCSNSLECLEVTCNAPRKLVLILPRSYLTLTPPVLVDSEPEASIDLSKATRLKSVVFRAESWPVGWITTALRTITPEHPDLREISIDLHYWLVGFDRGTIGEADFGWLWDLDRVLVQLCESRSIRPRIWRVRSGGEEHNAESSIKCLLPETAKRGIIDLI